MVPGKPLTARQKRKIARAVDLAERECGLQVCIYLGAGEDDMRAQAERMLAELGLIDAPAVMMLVSPPRRHFEIVTTPAARRRVGDRECGFAAAAMTASFSVGDIAGGVAEGVRLIAQYAGAGVETPGGELPDILDATGDHARRTVANHDHARRIVAENGTD